MILNMKMLNILNLKMVSFCMEDCSGISLQSRCWYWCQVLSVAVLGGNVSLTGSTA